MSRRECQASQRKGLTFGELPVKSGNLPGNLWTKFHSERTFGEVAGELLGKFGELLGKSGDFPEARGCLTPSQRLAKFVSKYSIIRNFWKGWWHCCAIQRLWSAGSNLLCIVNLLSCRHHFPWVSQGSLLSKKGSHCSKNGGGGGSQNTTA